MIASAVLDFLWNVHPEKAGGASFVQMVLGFNIAFVAWDRFREKIQVFGLKADSIVSTATANTLDGKAKKRIGKFFVSIAKRSKKIHGGALVGAYTLGWTSIFAALYMLWADRFCAYDWILLTPIVGYFTISVLVWVVLLWLSKFVNWLCEEDFEKGIDELEKNIGAAEDSRKTTAKHQSGS